MNSTRWVTLTEFVKHLGRTGVARVDETEKGWFIAWIDSSPKALAKAVRQFFQAAVSISWSSIRIRKRL
jgi:beta-lactamase class D